MLGLVYASAQLVPFQYSCTTSVNAVQDRTSSNEFLRVRCPALETEVAEAMQLGVFRQQVITRRKHRRKVPVLVYDGRGLGVRFRHTDLAGTSVPLCRAPVDA